MAGLLGEIYSQGDRLKRKLGGLLSDPLGAIQQTAGLLSDYRNEDSALQAQAFGNLRNPLQVTDSNAVGLLADRTLAGPLGLAPVAMTEIVKPTAQQLKAWAMGQRHRKMLGDEKPSSYFYEELPQSELDFVSRLEENMPVSRGFYESALRGAEMPKRSKGTRYGEAPKSGVSLNHVDGGTELGVSMAKVPGVDYQWYPMQKVGKPFEYDGWLLDPAHFWGSDGEPLMLGLSPFKP